ncbi:hypothetical protein BDZ91DRAFT_768697 [Kalaharituber pfeilii]|nr:hypothetical protein BDZ91DRAFT_768697 [Kalaharituber pfeilii]
MVLCGWLSAEVCFVESQDCGGGGGRVKDGLTGLGGEAGGRHGLSRRWDSGSGGWGGGGGGMQDRTRDWMQAGEAWLVLNATSADAGSRPKQEEGKQCRVPDSPRSGTRVELLEGRAAGRATVGKPTRKWNEQR